MQLFSKLALILKLVIGVKGEKNLLAVEDKKEIVRGLKEIRRRIYRRWIR